MAQSRANFSSRNLTKTQLGGVVFGCTKHTIKECLSKHLFGLPYNHISYVQKIDTALPLFLFNYSDRKLHGIFEAAGPGLLNINPYAWTSNGSDRTSFPAQVPTYQLSFYLSITSLFDLVNILSFYVFRFKSVLGYSVNPFLKNNSNLPLKIITTLLTIFGSSLIIYRLISWFVCLLPLLSNLNHPSVHVPHRTDSFFTFLHHLKLETTRTKLSLPRMNPWRCHSFLPRNPPPHLLLLFLKNWGISPLVMTTILWSKPLTKQTFPPATPWHVQRGKEMAVLLFHLLLNIQLSRYFPI